LSLANVEAYLAVAPATGTLLTALTTIQTSGLAGSYTYSYTADCIASGTLSPLGLNNIYHQYYSYAMTAGAVTVPTIGTAYITVTSIASITPVSLITTIAVFYGCYHSHIYNWMATPAINGATVTTSLVAGFGNAVVGYGYAMTGTATTSCTASTVVSTTLFKTNVFYGGQYQS
jgi:hypothetical protein